MIRTATLETILAVLFVIVLLWIFQLLFTRRIEHIGRPLIIAVVLGIAFFFVQTIPDDTIVFEDIKESLFPPKAPDYPFTVSKGTSGRVPVTKYSFPEPGPRLKIRIDDTRKFFHIHDVRPLNRILAYLDLPPVSAGIEELSSLTGRNTDNGIYRWDDYALGVLIVERGLCRNRDSADTFHCIQAITVHQQRH
ncbi:MAG: hypothetical protein SCM96_14655 [Acidobacteriota bacterium]|nr:hypothetical protein [Acidobacteriota bacterium]